VSAATTQQHGPFSLFYKGSHSSVDGQNEQADSKDFQTDFQDYGIESSNVLVETETCSKTPEVIKEDGYTVCNTRLSLQRAREYEFHWQYVPMSECHQVTVASSRQGRPLTH
jgi:hypothetical protein